MVQISVRSRSNPDWALDVETTVQVAVSDREGTAVSSTQEKQKAEYRAEAVLASSQFSKLKHKLKKPVKTSEKITARFN